ncbi:DEAD-domain-containing protein, partial [Martensiomyces pterosporus]
MASEAAVQRQVEQLESQTIDPKTDLSGSKQQGTSDGAAPEYVPVPFQSYTTVHQKTKLAIERLMKFKTASKVQDQIISRLPIERDIMIKAKTGTGKTTAFLVPAIETLLREYEKDPARASNGRAVGCLIVSPTRELAKQIATEAEKLVKFHGWNVQSLVGGERSRDQLNSLARNRSDIVIGTPGRILDFMENQPMFQNLASKTKLLVFDEADVLLQMGFRREIGEIIANVPTDRQTFLVSATIDKKIKELAPEVFHRGFDLVDCVEKGETNTHHNVKQEYITVENSQHFPVLCDAMQTHISKNKAEGHGSKIIVFMPTTKSADMNSRPAGERVEVFLLHGKMTQEARSRISDRFRNSPVDANTTSILITTDVSARGVDYPNVSMVMQVGIPTEAEAYIHRLGRTGRAGKSGEGVILLNSIETKFLKQLKNVPIK